MVQRAVYASDVKKDGAYWMKYQNEDWVLVDVSMEDDGKSFDALELPSWESTSFGEGSDFPFSTTEYAFFGPLTVPANIYMPIPSRPVTVLAPPLVRASDGRVVPPPARKQDAVRTEVRFQN